MQERSVGIVETRHLSFAEPPGELVLDCGRKLGPVTLAYETYGELNEDRSNAVLICHALTGDAHVAGRHAPDDRKPGWWDPMVGPGKAFDTERYYVICANIIGGCMGSTGPSSINPETGKPYGLSFPIITIGDMVRAQLHLLEHLGIDRLLSVAGGSLGGMQVLEWMTRYPDRVSSAMVIASSHMNSAQSIAFDAVGRNAIQADPAFRKGDYYDTDGPAEGLAIARMLAHITYLSDEAMHTKFGRELRTNGQYRYDFSSEFAVETYLDYQGEQFVNRFDANSYLYVTKAADYFDLSASYGSLDAAMARVLAKVLVVSFSSDWLFPQYQSEEIVYALKRQKKDVTYCSIESDYGHDAFLLEVNTLKQIISGFLGHVLPSHRCCAECAGPGHGETNPCLGPRSGAPHETPKGARLDYDMIADLVDPRQRVLDIGCGAGRLLCKLIAEKDVDGAGLELREENIVRCINRGISVIHADVDKGLAAFPDQSYDWAVMSMTLQVLENPELVIKEMLRVARKSVISFPNFAYWLVRLQLALGGRAPETRKLPFPWYASPNRHSLSIKDFRRFCRLVGAHIEQELLLPYRARFHPASLAPNLFADEAVFVISRETQNGPL